MSGSKVRANTANTAKVDSSQEQIYPVVQVKETEPLANTAKDDQKAYIQIMVQSAKNLSETGIRVEILQKKSKETGEPILIFAVYQVLQCLKCGSPYIAGDSCGICQIPQEMMRKNDKSKAV